MSETVANSMVGNSIGMELPDDFGKAKIKIVGVGGGGNNAVERMIEAGVEGVEFIIINTDAQILRGSKADVAIQIGKNTTKGLGAGANPEVGKRAAEENKEDIKKNLEGADMIFITAGMGGGTGTGAAPVVAEIAKSLDILTVAVVTRPLTFEGRARARKAEEGIKALSEQVDSIITINNDNLLKCTNKKDSIQDAFKFADEVLRQGIQGITDIINKKGIVNSDFADIKTVMKDSGVAHMGTGIGSGENAAEDAVRNAIESPILDTTIEGAKAILLYISGKNVSIIEANSVGAIVNNMVSEDAEIIFGTSSDDNLGDNIQVTLIATNINSPNTVFSSSIKKPSVQTVTPSSASVPAAQPQTVSVQESRVATITPMPSNTEPQIYHYVADKEEAPRANIGDEDGNIRKIRSIDVPKFPSFRKR